MKFNHNILGMLLEEERFNEFISDEKVEDVFFDLVAKKYCECIYNKVDDYEYSFIIEDAFMAGGYLGFYIDNHTVNIREIIDDTISLIKTKRLSFLEYTNQFLASFMHPVDIIGFMETKKKYLTLLNDFCQKNYIFPDSEIDSLLTISFYSFLVGASQGKTVHQNR